MRMLITQELTGAWETWTIEVPDGTTEEQVKNHDVEIEYLGIDDSGYDSGSITAVEALDYNPADYEG